LTAGSAAFGDPPLADSVHSLWLSHDKAPQKSWLEQLVTEIQSSSQSVVDTIRKEIVDATEAEIREVILRILAESMAEKLGKAIPEQVHSEAERKIKEKLKAMHKEAMDVLSSAQKHERVAKALSEFGFKARVLNSLSGQE